MCLRVSAEKFLGFMVSQRGIKVNPEKVKVIIDMQLPKNTKEVQRLAGRVATLSKFISRATYKCLPFFCLLKKVVCWDKECNRAFRELKDHLCRLPLTNQPKQGDVLFVYLLVSKTAISSF